MTPPHGPSLAEELSLLPGQADGPPSPAHAAVGENSTGKASFMAMLRALWDIALTLSTPDFAESPYDLGSFDDIACNGEEAARANQIEAGFVFRRKRAKGADDRRDRVAVAFSRKGSYPVLAMLWLAREDAWVEVRRGSDSSRLFRFATAHGEWKTTVQVLDGPGSTEGYAEVPA